MKRTLNKIRRNIRKEISQDIACYEWRKSIVLEGVVNTWDDVVRAGKLASNNGYKGVVNKIEVKGLEIPQIRKSNLKDNKLDGKDVDILIIGGGIIGCSIARELSKWDMSILLVEKEEDLAMHTSSRNDGMIHPGINPKPKSRKAYYNVRGNELYSMIAKELDVPFRRVGSLILFGNCTTKFLSSLLKLRAKKNGVNGVEYLNAQEIKKREPNITDGVLGGIYLPTTGVLSPYKMTIAYAENAIINGVEISLNTIVESMKKEQGTIKSVLTNRGTIYPKIVVNAAGVFSDKLADMAGDQFFTIHPRKGQILILDKKKEKVIDTIIGTFSIKDRNSDTKGGGIVKTIDSNILVGPDAYEQPYRENYETSLENINRLIEKQLPLVPKLSPNDIITYFAGIRASTYEEDFIVEASEYVSNLIHAAGIQSPGLASAPAIAEDIEQITVDMLKKKKDIRPKIHWVPARKGIPYVAKLSHEERRNLIKKRPDYGTVICRCEEISKGEIIDAINSPIPVSSLDAIKRRVRAGMGRCQGGFCMPLVMKIIEEQTRKDMLDITKNGNDSRILARRTKEEFSMDEGGALSDNV